MPGTTSNGVQYALPTDAPDMAAISLNLAASINPFFNDTGWIAVGSSGAAAFANFWSSGGGAQYPAPSYRLRYGTVWLKGVMQSGTAGNAAFILPAGMRPLLQTPFDVVSGVAGSARIDVFGNGTVQVTNYGTGGSNATVHLSSISFLAEQ